MSIARRVELRVVAIGGTLPEDLTNRLLSATYTDNEEDAADDFQLSYDNAINGGNSQWVEVKTTIAPPETGKLVQQEIAPTETIDYIVQRGDTLSAIAAKYLGSASKYDQIVQEIRYNERGEMITVHPSWCGIYVGDYTAHIIFQKNLSYTYSKYGFMNAKHRDLPAVLEKLDAAKTNGYILCECCACDYERRKKQVEKLGYTVYRSNISACESDISSCVFLIA